MSGLFGSRQPASGGLPSSRRPDPGSFAARYGGSPAPPSAQAYGQPPRAPSSSASSFEKRGTGQPQPHQNTGGSEQFTAVPCPDEALALTNRIIFNPADFTTGAFVQVKGNYVGTAQ